MSPADAMSVEESLRRALAMGDEGDYEGMATELREALEDDPDDAAILCWLGVAERELGLDGVAYERFKRCLAQQPEDPWVLATAGTAVAAFDDPDAEAALRTASVLGPDLEVTRWMYGAYLSREGFHEDALRELEAARELAPDEPVVHLELGVAHALAGRLEQASDALQRAVELDAEDGWARVLLGLTLVEADRLEEAAGDLASGARLRPGDVEAQMLASLAAAATGWDDLAFEMLERARQAAEGVDRATVVAVEERLDRGPDDARRFLLRTLAPGAFRERLMTRP